MDVNEPPLQNWKLDLKHVLLGGAIAILWLAAFILAGAIWSVTHTETLRVLDHLHNGWVFAKLMNLVALIGGSSVGIYALFHLSRNRKSNFSIIGFAFFHCMIVALLWTFGPLDFRQDVDARTKIEKVLGFKDRLTKPN